ncbi:unnamed protein product [Gemmataceae bacterium]|nr:unnamed protein product [Gemmataceae bacterium]VTT98779.1 unnamed protein product [Gemmataceae bacterium]
MKSNPKVAPSVPKKRTPKAPAAPAQVATPKTETEAPPPGLDESRHAAAQRAAQGGEVLRHNVFAAFMATSLALDKFFDANAYRVYLAGVMRDLGDPKDPIERMLIEQLCLAHFRVGQLHGAAGQANGLEGTKLLNSVAARMLGEMRRTALSLKAYRTTATPTNHQKDQLKLFKAAQ